MRLTVHSVVVLALFATFGCESEERTPLTNTSLAIGDACEPSDGYEPSYPWSQPDAAGCDAPCGYEPPEGTLERHELPPGIAYCLNNGGYPGGYLVSNCDTDADCPVGSSCSGAGYVTGQCRVPCSSDEQCRSPMVCKQGGNFDYCFCSECLAER